MDILQYIEYLDANLYSSLEGKFRIMMIMNGPNGITELVHDDIILFYLFHFINVVNCGAP